MRHKTFNLGSLFFVGAAAAAITTAPLAGANPPPPAPPPPPPPACVNPDGGPCVAGPGGAEGAIPGGPGGEAGPGGLFDADGFMVRGRLEIIVVDLAQLAIDDADAAFVQDEEVLQVGRCAVAG